MNSFSTGFCSKTNYFCIISIFFWRCGVSHNNAMHLIISLSKIDCPMHQDENSSLPQKCSKNWSLDIKVNLKFIIAINTSAIQQIFCIIYSFRTHDFQHNNCDIIFLVLLYPYNFLGMPLLTYTFYKNLPVLTKTGNDWSNLKQSKTS